ncbi:hypothetical protein F3Y22_tig00110776pilonHSYRG00048 [Hibiscus syriacus]|uniref:DNA (Cytosine-5)-methyltransferase DRM1/2 n=1 Tax=Hibiscus syriacus TaxID=106335 RepID=A0A6A2ZTI2_HIBSY|nr:hypothetical protein F3Y22_tig00110776pilonHSYRG00048 [Hibiscus syriacus]
MVTHLSFNMCAVVFISSGIFIAAVVMWQQLIGEHDGGAVEVEVAEQLEGLPNGPEVLSSCIVGLTDDPKVLRMTLRFFLKTSCTEGLTDDPKVLKTSCTEGLTDDPKVLKTSCTEGLTDDPKVLKTSCTEGLTDDPKVLKTSCTEGLTDDPKVLKTSCTKGLTDDPKALKTSCTEGLTDDPKILKTSCIEGLTDDLKALKTSCTEGLTNVGNSLLSAHFLDLEGSSRTKWYKSLGNSFQADTDDFTDIDSSSDTEEILNSDSDEENKLLNLTKMGYSEAKASIAMERYGPDSSIVELTDFICAAQMAKAADALFPITQRTFPEDAIRLPYSYYENVALATVGVWTEMSRDPRTKLNCLQICTGSVKLIEKICKAFEAYDDEPPSSVQKYVLDECRKGNMVWVGRNKVVPLKPDEVEILLELNGDRLEQLMNRFGKFDLVVGSIQYNNLIGRNKHHRDELKDFCWCSSCNDCYSDCLFAAPKYSLLITFTLPEPWKGGDLFIPIIHLNGTHRSVIGGSARDMD